MRVVIIDADAAAADLLRGKLSEITDSEILCFGSASDALLEVEEGWLRPDVCFIDLSPEDVDTNAGAFSERCSAGIKAAKLLQQMLPRTQIIFVSAYDSYYLTAYEVEHAFFLHKPVEFILLRKAWARAIEHLDYWEQRNFCFHFDRIAYQIPLRDILYFEKDRRRIILHTTDTNDTHYFYGTMDELMRQLDRRFIRCHNSYVINLTRTDTWSRTAFTIGQHKIPISRQYAKAAKAAFLDARKG